MWNCRQGEPECRPGTGPLTGAHRKHPGQGVERLTHLGRVGERAEVEIAAPMGLPGEHDPRKVVVDGYHDVGVRLVVAQPDVERCPVLLDEVVLEQQRLDLVGGRDPLHGRGPAQHLVDFGRQARGIATHPGQVARQPLAQRKSLTHVDDITRRVAVQVDSGEIGRILDLFLEIVTSAHGLFSVLLSFSRWARPGPCYGEKCGLLAPRG